MTAFSINTNGLGCHNQPKLQSVSNTIRKLAPDIFIINETKSHKYISAELQVQDLYSIHENPGVVCESQNWKSVKSKWGVILGIHQRHTIAHKLTLKLHEDLRGRVAAVDICIKVSNAEAIYSRIIAVYAPYSYNANPRFWHHITELCMESKGSWMVMGDVNLSIAECESRGTSDSKMIETFAQFLSRTDGRDLWSKNPDRHFNEDWTYKFGHDKDAKMGCSIIDRTIISNNGWMDGEIRTLCKTKAFIPSTDHRIILATLIPSGPNMDTVANNGSPCLSDVLFRPPLRLKQPKREEKSRFTSFSRTITDAISKGEWGSCSVNNDEDFIELYNTITRYLTVVAKDHFESNTYRTSVNRSRVTNQIIQLTQRELKKVGGAIHHYKNPDARISTVSLELIAKLEAEDHIWNKQFVSSLSHLKSLRKQLNKTLYKEKSEELRRRKLKMDKWKITSTLRGGSSKRLYRQLDQIALPTTVNPLLDPNGIKGDENSLVSDPELVKSVTQNYWSNLYQNQGDPDVPKPWLDTPSVTAIKEHTMKDPMKWPLLLDLASLKALMRRGNQSPAPGPDGWEKWIVKRLPDEALSYIIALANYIIEKSHFPGDCLDSWLAMFHKKGLATLLTNWRGIALANFIANLPMSWLTYNITPYLIKLGIVPDSQIANHTGIQARDVTSLLSSISCWARRHDQTVYMVKRDQMKGFDFLSKTGFHDAIRAYGLPEEIITLDDASLKNIKYQARTAYGLTEPFYVDGLTKQGGNLSPCKCVMTTSLLNWWLRDRIDISNGGLTLQTINASNGTLHTPLDKISQSITLTEAMDDSIVFSTNIDAMNKYVLASEHFLLAYQWRTNWDKSSVSIFSGEIESNIPDYMNLPSVSPDNTIDPMSVTYHKVKVYKNEIEYLRTGVNDPKKRAKEIKDLISLFQFPRFITKTPITLARKIIQQTLIAQIRAKLALQPILTKDAEDLDTQLTNKIHESQCMPYKASSVLMTLPFELNGFGFPSIVNLNLAIAYEGLERDLNHHVPLFRNIAQITLADWMCQHNNCSHPLDDMIPSSKENSRIIDRIPVCFIVAQNAMHKTLLRLRPTDFSFIATGDIALRHILNALSSSDPNTPRKRDITLLERYEYHNVRDIGTWQIGKADSITFHKTIGCAARKETAALKRAHSQCYIYLSNLNVLSAFKLEDTSMLLDRDTRRQRAEDYIIAHLRLRSEIRPEEPISDHQWGTDGSQTPANAKATEKRSTFATSIGPRSLSLKLNGTGNGILQAEITGNIIANLDIKDLMIVESDIFTDHLYTVIVIQDHDVCNGSLTKLNQRNGRSYYRWLLVLIDATGARVHHVKAHTTDQTLAAKLNAAADKEASSGHKYSESIPNAPIPTFFMNEFTSYSNITQWHEGGSRGLIEHMLHEANKASYALNSYRLPNALHSNLSNPEYMYKTATSAYSATLQLYIRSGQLPTKLLMSTRPSARTSKEPIVAIEPDKWNCPFKCDAIEGPIHLFYLCKSFDKTKADAVEDLKTKIGNICDTYHTSQQTRNYLNSMVSEYFVNYNHSSIECAFYYMGIVPSLIYPRSQLINKNPQPSEITIRRFETNLHAEIHNAAIRLTSRIWGLRTKQVLNPIGGPSPLARP